MQSLNNTIQNKSSKECKRCSLGMILNYFYVRPNKQKQHNSKSYVRLQSVFIVKPWYCLYSKKASVWTVHTIIVMIACVTALITNYTVIPNIWLHHLVIPNIFQWSTGGKISREKYSNAECLVSLKNLLVIHSFEEYKAQLEF